MMGTSIATGIVKKILAELLRTGKTVVFAESCTAGNVAVEFAKVPGASDVLCGSFVTYRARMKRKLLGVKKKTIKKYTTESSQVAEQMARGALEGSGADWSAAVVGHFGPKAPEDKDGKIWVAVAQRVMTDSKKAPTKIKSRFLEVQLKSKARIARCKEATEVVLVCLDKAIFHTIEETDELLPCVGVSVDKI
jgi:PncC family amidohydrolase